MDKWQKVGEVRLSKSQKALIVFVDVMNPKKCFVIRVEPLLDVICGYKDKTELYEVQK